MVSERPGSERGIVVKDSWRVVGIGGWLVGRRGRSRGVINVLAAVSMSWHLSPQAYTWFFRSSNLYNHCIL